MLVYFYFTFCSLDSSVLPVCIASLVGAILLHQGQQDVMTNSNYQLH